MQRFADEVGLPCVSLLGSQLAPEDLIGVPQIVDGCSRFCPPVSIARTVPYCLFLDELNACSHEVQKAFYSLIHERRIGEYCLPEGSVVIGAGNRAQDSAIVKPMSSALINRMIHVHLKVSHRDWLEWAGAALSLAICLYIMLSDALHEYGDALNDQTLEVLAFGCVSAEHAGQFKAFAKQIRSQYKLKAILDGDTTGPAEPQDRDILYFLAQSFRAHLVKELPVDRSTLSAAHKELAHRGKALLKELASISLEMAQMVVSDSEGESLPNWLLVEIVRDLPRLVMKKVN